MKRKRKREEVSGRGLVPVQMERVGEHLHYHLKKYRKSMSRWGRRGGGWAKASPQKGKRYTCIICVIGICVNAVKLFLKQRVGSRKGNRRHLIKRRKSRE